MAIDGRRSIFPTSLDDWGAEFQDDVCQVLTADRFNTIQDALLRLEDHAHHLFITGQAGVLTPAISGSLRPKVLFKTYTVTATGAASTYTFPLSGFTSQEQSLFGGTPLASGNLIHTQIRKAAGNANDSREAFHCGVAGPITDPTGSSGWQVVAAPLDHSSTGHQVTAADYVVSVLITGG